MSGQDLNANKLAAYQKVCENYRAIDDFRAKLLGFLPLASFAGIFVVLPKTNEHQELLMDLIVPFGIFGFFVASGLFIFELYGIRKCTSVINCGKDLEGNLGLKGLGYFTTLAGPIGQLVAEPLASGVIYGAVLAAWSYLTVYFVDSNNYQDWAAPLAILVFITTLLLAIFPLLKEFVKDRRSG